MRAASLSLSSCKRLAQFRILRVVDWEQAGVDHWLRITVAFERLGSRIYGGGDGVAHLDRLTSFAPVIT